jgi:hypothetical protein
MMGFDWSAQMHWRWQLLKELAMGKPSLVLVRLETD